MRKRSTVRGIVSAMIFHYLVLIGLALLVWFLRPFIWAAVYGVPYQRTVGAMDKNSGEWLIIKAIYYLSWIAAGYAACRWDRKNSNRSVLVVGALTTLLALVGGGNVNNGWLLSILAYFEIPMCLVIGLVLLRYIEARKGWNVVGGGIELIGDIIFY